MFQEALQFKDIIILCYSKQNIVKKNGGVPPFLNWYNYKIIADSLFFVVIACVLNQSNSHWVFYDALQYAITMCLKLREKIINPYALVNLIDDDFSDYFLIIFVCFQH